MNRVSRVSSRPSHVRERLIGALVPDTLNTRTETTIMRAYLVKPVG